MAKHLFWILIITSVCLSSFKLHGEINWSWWIVLLPAYFFPLFVVGYAIIRAIIFRIWGKKNLKNGKRD